MAVVAVGDFDPKKIEEQIRKQLGVLKNPGTERPRDTFPVPAHQETLQRGLRFRASCWYVDVYARRHPRFQAAQA
jgi:predicted Zn-dependent peptidase